MATADFDKSQICAHVENNPSSIILLKTDHPGEPCLELIASVSRTFDNVKVLILGDPASDPPVVNYLEAGAQGYIPDDATLSDVGKAIQQVEKGEVVCSQSAAPAIFGRLGNLYDETWRLHECESQILTLRESEIVELMAGGLTNGQIAEPLVDFCPYREKPCPQHSRKIAGEPAAPRSAGNLRKKMAECGSGECGTGESQKPRQG